MEIAFISSEVYGSIELKFRTAREEVEYGESKRCKLYMVAKTALSVLERPHSPDRY
jgi:hypothetical protein